MERLLVETIALAAPTASTGNSTITLNAGGAGIWVAVTCCLVSAVMNIGLAVAFIGHDRKIERMQDHLNAIYMIAPQLKDKQSN